MKESRVNTVTKKFPEIFCDSKRSESPLNVTQMTMLQESQSKTASVTRKLSTLIFHLLFQYFFAEMKQI